MVFAMVTRASYGARLGRPQFLDWSKASCLLRGLSPNVRDDKKFPMDTRRGFEKIAQPEAFDTQRALLPVQPDDKCRVWRVNSFATSPMFGGVFREDAAQQCGFRAPVSSSQEEGTRSGLWLTVVDPDATVAAPGFAAHVKEGAAGVEASAAHANAVISGKLFAKWFGNRASSGKETQVLVDNALRYADRYALEAGFRRRTSRVGIPNSRASWFVCDVPEGMGNAEWRLFEAAGESYFPASFRVAPYRIAEGMPLSDALRGPLEGQGYVYQYATRFSALVFLLVSVWLAPTASRRRRIMITEVFTRAMAARYRQMCAGSHDSGEVEEDDNSSAPRAYNSALGNTVGAVSFGIAVNDTREDAGMLQVRFAGTAPNLGEYLFALPSDCMPCSSRNGFFAIGASVPPDGVAESCASLVKEWRSLVRAHARGVRGGHARWLPGCHGRVSCGGVGGSRLLLLTPAPVSWDLWLGVSPNLRSANFASLAEVDKSDDPAESPSQRAKQTSPGGTMAAHASKNSAQRRANHTWPPKSVRERKVGPMVGGLILSGE